MQTYVGPKLFPWQKDVATAICNQKGTGKVCVVKAPRQRGKSYLCEGVLLWYAINQAKSENAMLSPTLAQSRKIYKEIVAAIYSSGIIKRKNETLLEIELINGSTIFFKSGEMREALRGYHVNGILILDEAAYLPPDILELVLPWRQVSNCPMLIVSTPKVRDGIFFNYYTEGINGNPLVTSIDWCDYDTSRMVTPEMIEQYRKVLTANQFKSEILGQWLDSDGMVFTRLKENATARQFNEGGNYNAFYGGIDWGAGNTGDYTVLTIFDERGEQVFLDYFNDLGTFQQIERIINDLQPFATRIRTINSENNSIGSPFNDLLIKTLREQRQNNLANNIERWITTNQSKSKLVTDFSVALERSEAQILDERQLLYQFGAFECNYNPKTQIITYEGAYGTHDDIVMATMLAWEAFKKYSTFGQYSISVV